AVGRDDRGGVRGAGGGRGHQHRRSHVVTRGILDAQNHKSLSRQEPLTPGKSYQITWKTLPLDYEFKAGHRLGLVLTGANDDFNLDVTGNGGGDDAEPGTGAKVTVDLAGTSISLPLVTGTSTGSS
ncbi:CocE/NonD family hydrolase C-terminal non-catalytic domain-containing protein, partial [Nonomuraea sp. NPDC001684]